MAASCRIATRGVMEFSDWSLPIRDAIPPTDFSNRMERKQSGKIFPLNFHFVASTFPLDRCSGNKEEICFRLVASLFPLCFHLSNNRYLQQR
jgi:hypothetical protein